jgi:retron-type reverse transcriptase
MGIKVNDQMGCYFQTRKGLWQGDPLSPILFNIVVDMLAIIIVRAKLEDGQIKDWGQSIMLEEHYCLIIFHKRRCISPNDLHPLSFCVSESMHGE